MLSADEKAGIAAMDRDQLLALLGVIRKAKAMFGTGCMPASAVKALTEAVPDEQVRAIVHDLKGGLARPGGLLDPGPAREVVRGSGWAEPRVGGPPGLRWIDQQLDVADAMDRRELRERLGGGFKRRI